MYRTVQIPRLANREVIFEEF